MSSELRRQLRVALGPTITGLQRAVALEIADDARWDDDWNYDQIKGRRSRAKLTELVIWTGAKDTNVVRNAIKRLASAGWEFRIAIGKDKNGNPVFAVPGRAMTFRVPDFDVPVASEPTEGVAVATPQGEAGATPEPQGVAGATPMGSEGYPYGEQGLPIGVAGATPPSLVSPCSSPKESPSSSSVAEDSGDLSVSETETEEGGGGNLDSSEDQDDNDNPIARAEAFVDSLDYRGKRLGQTRRAKLTIRVVAAFKDGWTEAGLMRYLDISDDPTVRDPAAVYAHRLKPDELPDATVVVSPQLPPACWTCLGNSPMAATDLSLRINPITSDPCPDCHPTAVGVSPQLPDACQACMEENPSSAVNVRLRYRVIDDEHQACPDCHPKRIAVLATQKSQEQQQTDAWADRAMASAQQRLATGNWKGAGPDETAAGWMALSRGLGAKERKPATGRNYSNDIWQQPADPVQAARIPHCGSPNCDPGTRLKTEPDWTGKRHTAICGDCHPSMQF